MKTNEIILGAIFYIVVCLLFILCISPDLKCINSTIEMTVFQTGFIRSVKVVEYILIAVVCDFIFPIFIILHIISKIKDWKYKRQSRIKTEANINRLAVLLIALALVSGLWLVWLSFSFGFINDYPSSENISIDESEQVIKIQRQYLLKSDENLLIPFNEIDHAIYRFEKGYGDCPSQVTVEVTKIDGTKVEIYSDSRGGPLRDLAETIAKSSGKRLKQEHR